MSIIDLIEEYTGREKLSLEMYVKDLDASGPPPEDAAFLTFACTETDGRKGRAAMFVIRRLCEKKKTGVLDLTAVFKNIPTKYEWGTRFHLLQCVRYAPELALPYTNAIRSLFDDKQTAIRVVAMDAFTHLALAEPALVPEARMLIMSRIDDEKASLRSRARHMAEILDAHT